MTSFSALAATLAGNQQLFRRPTQLLKKKKKKLYVAVKKSEAAALNQQLGLMGEKAVSLP